MTRFQTQGPRVAYAPVESEKPFKQIVGLYNMWQALGPETREWIANLFRRKGRVTSDALDPALDTSLVYQKLPDFNSTAAKQATTEELVGMPVDWGLVDTLQLGSRTHKPRYPEVGADTSGPFGMTEEFAWLSK